MNDALLWFYDAIRTLDWLEIIRSLAPMATAIIAFSALRNWQRQDRAKRKIEFLDALLEAAHAFIAEMGRPISQMRMIKTGMESFTPTWEEGAEDEKAIKGAIAYIQKHGHSSSERLYVMLKEVEPLVTKLRSLAVKGQIFLFSDYNICQDAVTMLTWNFDRIAAFGFIAGGSSLNWEHPEVLDRLKNIMKIDPNDVNDSISRCNISLIEFAR